MALRGRRRAGLLVPLFSLRSRSSWGIGELADLPPLLDWLAAAGHGLLQLLPVFEVSAGERSPYAARSGFALDPIYLSLAEIEDFAAAGGEAALTPAEQAALAAARVAAPIAYDAVRRLKRRALELAHARFLATEWRGHSARADALRRYCGAERDWLPDYARLRAAADSADTALFHQYVQWVGAEQWGRVRSAAAGVDVALMGDFPFTIGGGALDVQAHPAAFDTAATLGAPPDAFSAEGQRWGLPVCRWNGAVRWLAGRAARSAALFDALRLDHVVGFYRQYVFAPDGTVGFVPPEEDAQLVLGERLLGAVQRAAAAVELIGEDLGVVPDFVRASLARLDIPGYRVLRWETDAGRFRDPHAYPARSLATSGTHDTSALAEWWETELDDAGRRALAEVPAFGALRDAGAAWTHAVGETLLDGLYAAGSDLVVLPVMDAYGGRERINVPATVSADNWSYRLPWTVEELGSGAAATLRDRLRGLAARHGRA